LTTKGSLSDARWGARGPSSLHPIDHSATRGTGAVLFHAGEFTYSEPRRRVLPYLSFVAHSQVVVESVADLLEVVLNLQRDGRDGLNRRELWFRGHANTNYQLLPGVFRDVPTENRSTVERRLTHTFRSRAGMHLDRGIDYNDRARWLATMQHHRLPTRLLDWSRSVLVATYFAVERSLPDFFEDVDPPASDAALWILDPADLNSRTCPSTEGTVGALESGVLHALVAEAFYDPRTPPREPIEPPVHAALSLELDIRMFVQQGCFTIHGAAAGPLEFQEWCEPFLTKVEIPSESVPRMAEEVQALGLSEGDIYPDLDHLSAELVRKSPLPFAWRNARQAAAGDF